MSFQSYIAETNIFTVKAPLRVNTLTVGDPPSLWIRIILCHIFSWVLVILRIVFWIAYVNDFRNCLHNDNFIAFVFTADSNSFLILIVAFSHLFFVFFLFAFLSKRRVVFSLYVLLHFVFFTGLECTGSKKASEDMTVEVFVHVVVPFCPEPLHAQTTICKKTFAVFVFLDLTFTAGCFSWNKTIR